MLGSLRQAYGIDAATDDQLGARVPDGRVFVTLASDYDPLKPAAANFRGAVEAVLGGALDARYPRHPKIDRGGDEVRRAELTAVLDLARRAMAGGGRIESVDRATATKVRRVVEGFGVGRLREITYVLAPQFFPWNDDFTRATAGGDATVGALRAAMDDYGLTVDEQDLLVLAWVAMTDRVLRRYGGRLVDPAIGTLAPEVTLHEPVLPDEDEWTAALARAKALFGAGADEYHLSSAAVERLGAALGRHATECRSSVDDLVHRLERHAATLGLDDVSPRLATARRARDLAAALTAADAALDRVRVLAEFDLPAELGPFAHGIKTAAEVAAAIEGANWDLLDRLAGLGEPAETAVRDLQQAARAEQLSAPLRPALVEANRAANRILTEQAPKPTGPTPDELEARRRAEEERRRLADEQQRLADEQARVRREQDRIRREQEQVQRQQAELDRQRREAEERARATHRVEVTRVTEVQELSRALTDELLKPVAGKKLRVEWRWE